MLDYAQIHVFDACGHYKGRLLLILILHNVMHDITSTLPVDSMLFPPLGLRKMAAPCQSPEGARSDPAKWLWYGYATVIAAIFVKTTPLFRAARDRCWCVHWLPQPA